MADQLWYIKNLDLFSGLQDLSYDSVAEHSREVHWEPRQIISFQGETLSKVFVIVDGRVQISHLLPDGREVILTYLENGAFWGAVTDPGEALSSMAGQLDSHQAAATKPTTALEFEGAYFRRMLERRPRVAFKLMRLLGLRQKHVELRLINLCFKNNLQKLASLLLELAETHGEKTDAGIRIRLALTHQELGSMVGMTREQVTKLIKQLRDAGAVHVVKGRMFVSDAGRLAALGGSRV